MSGSKVLYVSVIRRVGGLEVVVAFPFFARVVIRRVGGLEVREEMADMEDRVIRRVGGLED